MRVGLIAPPWVPVPPVAYGGIERMIDVLARGLQRAGVEVTLFATGDSTCPVPRKYTYEDSSKLRMGHQVAAIDHSLAAYESIGEVDIIHDHTNVGPFVSYGQTDVPVVATNHGVFQADTMRRFEAFSRRGIPIIAISYDQAAHASEDINISRVIHHGLDTERIPFGPGGGGYLTCLGRMVPEKGIHKACEIARKAGVPLRIGAKMRDPHEYQYFEEFVKPLLGGNIEYLGELNTQDKMELLSKTEALLNPIQWAEPFGLVMLEALATGSPVLVPSIGAAPEIVTDGVTGILCETDKDFVAAIDRVSELDRGECRLAAETTFSMNKMIEDHIAFYKCILRQRGLVIDLDEAEAIDLNRQVQLT